MGKQTKYTKSARGQDCQIRVPGICNFNNETTVFAHLNGGGAGMKHADIHGSYSCSDCHDTVDGRHKTNYLQMELEWMHYEGMVRTQQIMINNGVLKL